MDSGSCPLKAGTPIRRGSGVFAGGMAGAGPTEFARDRRRCRPPLRRPAQHRARPWSALDSDRGASCRVAGSLLSLWSRSWSARLPSRPTSPTRGTRRVRHRSRPPRRCQSRRVTLVRPPRCHPRPRPQRCRLHRHRLRPRPPHRFPQQRIFPRLRLLASPRPAGRVRARSR